MNEKLLDTSEAAKILGVDRHNVARWSRERKINFVLLPNGRRRYREQDINEFIESRLRRAV